MVSVRGCQFPDDRLYDVGHHVWCLPLEGGLVRMGITIVGVALAREVLIFTPKRAGRPFQAGKAIATIESAKWIGSVRAGFDGAVEAVNERLVAGAAVVNRDCYGEGWMVDVKPDREDWNAGLVAGSDLAPAYEAWMEENGFPGCGAAP